MLERGEGSRPNSVKKKSSQIYTRLFLRYRLLNQSTNQSTNQPIRMLKTSDAYYHAGPLRPRSRDPENVGSNPCSRYEMFFFFSFICCCIIVAWKGRNKRKRGRGWFIALREGRICSSTRGAKKRLILSKKAFGSLDHFLRVARQTVSRAWLLSSERKKDRHDHFSLRHR